MSTIQTTISTDRECDSCGYNLKGLQMGGKCPECGASIRRLSSSTSGYMSDEAPTRFVRVLRIGYLIAAASCLSAYFITSIVLINIILALIFGMSLTPRTGRGLMLMVMLASLPWPIGVFLATTPRPRKGAIRPDKILDNDRLRLIVRLASCTWPIYTLCTLALVMVVTAAAPSKTLVIATAALSIISGAAAWIGLIPTSIYFAETAYWSANDPLANRLRSTAWVLAVLGTLSCVMIGISLTQGVPMLFFVAVIPAIILLVTLFIFNIGVLQIASAMKWVINHQVLAAGSFERIEERRKKEEQYKGRIVDDTPCDYCGFNLIGLEQGGRCPECGTLFTHKTGHAIRDPAKTPSYHDNSDLEVEEGENKGVYFNDQLDAYGKPKAAGVAYTPAIEVPDEGDIPLSMDDEDSDHSTSKSPSKDDSHDIDGIEPNSLA